MSTGYKGSDGIKVSVSMQEILPSAPIGWTQPYNFLKFSFRNLSACHVIINNGDQIYLGANDGLNFDKGDVPIYSLKICESNVNYYWFGEF